MDVLWISRDGSVWDRNFNNVWEQPVQIAPAGSAAVGGITAVSRAVNTVETWWIGNDGSIQGAYWYNGGRWTHYQLASPGSASPVSRITAVSRAHNHVEVWWVKPNGAVQGDFWYDPGPWTQYTLASPGSASTMGRITAVSPKLNHMEVWWVRPDGSVQGDFWYDPGPWTQYTLASSGSASATGGITAVSRHADTMEVWWIGQSGQVGHASWYGQWNQKDLAPAGSASLTSGIASISRTSNSMDVLWTAPDGSVQDASKLNVTDWQLQQLAPPGSASTSAGIAAVSRIFNSVEVWWIGPGGSVQDAFWFGPQWKPYPHLEAQPTIHRRWLVLKCALSDNPEIPAPKVDTLINSFLTPAGAGTGNITDYYSDVTYGAMSFDGTDVVGWVYAPKPIDGSEDRTTRVQACAESIPSSVTSNPSFSFDNYWGIIVVTNHRLDAGACYDGQGTLEIHNRRYTLGCLDLDPDNMYTAVAAHEVGHGLGMPHSFDNIGSHCGGAPGEYCDKWDIMSAGNTYQFDWPNYPSAGPGVNVPNLLFLGGIPHTFTYPIGSPGQRIVLAALSHPTGSLPLALKIVGQNPNDFYAVEYRQTDGWDTGLPENAVLIHEYKVGAAPYSYLLKNAYSFGRLNDTGVWVPPMRWVDPSGQVEVWVDSIDSKSGTATISVGPVSLLPW